MSLKFGVHLPIHGIYSYGDIMKVAVAADKLGYNSLWVGDHFYLPREYYILRLVEIRINRISSTLGLY